MNEVQFDDSKPVDSYGPGFFRVGGQVMKGPVLLLPTGAAIWGGYEDVAALIAVAGQVDVLLLGTGAEIAHPPSELKRAVEAAGLGLEVMASAAACRTYNVLLAEGRRVGVAMLPV